MSLAPLALLTLASPLAPPPLPAPQEVQLDFQEGRVTVAGDKAAIDLPGGWSYLQQDDARFVVEELWGNPPDPSVVGLVVPPGEGQEEGSDWAIVVSYEEEGHVDDGDAAHIDYGELLASMKEDAKAANRERRKAGYETVEVLGWAEQPHYDAREKKLYWAKSLQFGQTQGQTLNYNVRVLGREGVLVMNAVAGVPQLAEVAAGSKEVLAVTEFLPGHRYEDYDPGTDRLAAYGIGGLIAGKALAKAGLFKALVLLLAKGWKLVVIGFLAVAGGLGKLFGRKRATAVPEGPPLEPLAQDDELQHRDAA